MPAIKTISLQNFFTYCTDHGLPLAIYRLPGENQTQVVAQKSNRRAPKTKNAAEQKGFLFAPFNESAESPVVLIRPEIFTSADKLPALNFAPKKKVEVSHLGQQKIKKADKKDYIDYVEKIKTQIEVGSFTKIVAARVAKKKKPKDFNPISFFEKLSQKYPLAFISLVFTPQHGLWIGASPEILLRVSSKGFTTYSLAGTKANTALNQKNAWGEKEKEEQQIVSEYITAAFRKATTTKPVVKGPETIAAGNLLHLRTTFTYKAPKKSWPLVVSQLHPTPAVAGLPKNESIKFITGNEKADRSYYSGYLGPVNLGKEINLFVNLRCMQVLKNKLAIHVGCGITKDSNPAAEWKESKMKAETLLSVLK